VARASRQLGTNGKDEKLFLAMAVVALAQSTDISGERIRAHVKFLASDLLEGRGVGARGGDIATEYIAAQFALAGAKALWRCRDVLSEPDAGRRGSFNRIAL